MTERTEKPERWRRTLGLRISGTLLTKLLVLALLWFLFFRGGHA
jgi:hypothetical protein